MLVNRWYKKWPAISLSCCYFSHNFFFFAPPWPAVPFPARKIFKNIPSEYTLIIPLNHSFWVLKLTIYSTPIIPTEIKLKKFHYQTNFLLAQNLIILPAASSPLYVLQLHQLSVLLNCQKKVNNNWVGNLNCKKWHHLWVTIIVIQMLIVS